MAKFCTNCGTKLPDGVRFCPECGTAVGVVIDAPVGSTVTVSDTPPQAAVGVVIDAPVDSTVTVSDVPPEAAARQTPKRKAAPQKEQPMPASQKKLEKPAKRGSSRGLCLFLALVMLVELAVAGFKYPGFLKKKQLDAVEAMNVSADAYIPEAPAEGKGVSSVAFDAARYRAEPERCTVDAANPVCISDSGVRVEFGDYCLTEEPAEVEILPLGEQSDGAYRCVGYDFQLNEAEAEFAGLAAITVPYDPAWGENVFVQYFNEETGAWETLYTETDGAGNATFYTDHFCTFAVFHDMVENGTTASATDPVVRYYEEPGSDGRHLRATVDYAALAARLRSGDTVDLSAAAANSADDWVRQGLSLMDTANSISDYSIQYSELGTANYAASEALAGASKVLSRAGMAITVAKILTQYYRTGDLQQTLEENKLDLTALGLAVGGELATGALATFCSVAGLAVFVYGACSGVYTDINLQGGKNETDWGYRHFTNNYIVYNRKSGVCSARYVADAWDDANTVYDANAYPLRTDGLTDYIDWKLVFSDAKQLKGGNAAKKIDNVVTQYVNVFWNLDQATLKKYLKNERAGLLSLSSLESKYKTPTAEQRKQYTQQYRQDLYGWLRPYMKGLLEKAYLDVLTEAYCAAQALEESMNEELSFVLRDASGKDFADSEYAGCRLELVCAADDASGWTFTEDNSYTVTCTRASYLRAGCPALLRISEGDTLRDRVEVTFSSPVTTIVLGQEEPPETEDWEEQDFGYGRACTLTFDYMTTDTSRPGQAVVDALKKETLQINQDGSFTLSTGQGESAIYWDPNDEDLKDSGECMLLYTLSYLTVEGEVDYAHPDYTTHSTNISAEITGYRYNVDRWDPNSGLAYVGDTPPETSSERYETWHSKDGSDCGVSLGYESDPDTGETYQLVTLSLLIRFDVTGHEIVQGTNMETTDTPIEKEDSVYVHVIYRSTGPVR